MQVIIAPISSAEPRENRAATLANLQNGLLLLLRGGAIPKAVPRQQFFEDGLQKEQREQVYGDITQQLVSMFQTQFARPPENPIPLPPGALVVTVTGNVDVPTAIVLNAALAELGALRLVEGKVTNRDGTPVVGNLLFAFDKDNIGGALLGQANSNADGSYIIFYDPSFYTRPAEGVLKIKEIIDLVVQVFDAQGKTLAASQPLHDPERKVNVDLKIGDLPEKNPFILRGQVMDVNGPMNGIEVTVFDRDLFFGRDGANNSQSLGTQITGKLGPGNEDGRFEFTYQTSDFSSGDISKEGETIPDLIFALSLNGQTLDKFQVFRLPDRDRLSEEILVSDDDLILGIQSRRVEEVRIFIPGGQPIPQPSEYERVWRAIEPLLPERAPEDADAAQREKVVCEAASRFDEEKHRDISFVARETALDPLLIKNFASGCKLAIDPFQNVLAASVFYALARLRRVSDLLALARLSTDDLTLALQQATMDAPPLIPSFNPVGLLKEAVQTIRNVLANRLPTHRSAEGEPSLADLVGADLPNPDEQATLWRIYSDHDGTTAEFWLKLKDQPGFEDPNKIARVQYSFQLGLLAQNNISLVNAVRSKHPEVNNTGDLAFLLDTPEKWTALLADANISIPPDVPGLPEERKANYAASLAGAVQIAHPTTVVATMVASLPPTHLAGAQPAVAKFLTGAVQNAKFDLATGRVDDLVLDHGEKLLEGVESKDRVAVIDQVKRVQRLFRLSSGPESMKALLDAGFHSAREIAQLSSAVVMDMLTPVLGEIPTRLLLNRAASITSETIHKFSLVNDPINGQIPQILKSLAVPKEMEDLAARPGPDYASLFGSVELCDCQDCRSIYSPAAYLVDLLQFLGLGLTPENPLITPLDVLIGNAQKGVKGRRPDIAHLLLSCENTNTTLPYVDLVNEVLESYIAFNQTLPLKTNDAGVLLVPSVPQPNESSEGVTAPELAANPEHTSDSAYEKLEASVYPFTLPFNQPMTALRLTLDQMGSGLHEVMVLFRRDDTDASGPALDVEALKLTEHEFTILTGKQFDGVAVPKPVSDFYGFSAPVDPSDTEWVAGSLPAGAQQHVDKDSWTFAAFVPAPPSGTPTHASAVTAGLHQHYFDKVGNAAQLKVENEDFLFAEVFLDPNQLPDELMLLWNDGTWEHRAFWGLSKIGVGVEGTASRRYMGPLPTAGRWERLEVPAHVVGVAGRDLSGIAFTLFGGGATWGAAGKRSASWIEALTHVPTLLSRTGLTYLELIDLLRTHYVNPALPRGEALAAFERIPIGYGVLTRLVGSNFAAPDSQTLKALDDAGMTLGDLQSWATEHLESLGKLLVLDAPDSACDLTLTRLQHLDGTLLDESELSRLHRFIRLWRKLGWTAEDLDQAFQALDSAEITPTFLRQLGQIIQLQDTLKLSPTELLSFWGPIPTEGVRSLYAKLFLNKAVREIDPVFEPVDGQYLAATGMKIKDHLPAMLAGLRVPSADLGLIRQHTGLDTDEAELTLATATTLYRYVRLTRTLKMAVKDLISLETISAQHSFSTLKDSRDTFTDIDPARTLQFIRLRDRVKESGFTPEALTYLFSSVATSSPGFAAEGETINLLLASMREGLIRIAAENVPTLDPTGETTRARLGLLFSAHVVEEIVGLVAGTQIYSAPLAANPGALPVSKVSYNKTSHLLQLAGWLTPAERDSLLPLPDVGDLRTAIESLFDQPRDFLARTLATQLGWATVETDLKDQVLEATSLGSDGKIDPALIAQKFSLFLGKALPFIRDALGRAFVKQTLAESLNLEPAATSLLLEGSNNVVPLGTDAKKLIPAIVDFQRLSGDGLSATYFDNETFNDPPRDSRVDPTIDFRWDKKHAFSALWAGKLLVDKSQLYQFHLRAGGDVKFMLDGKLLIDQREQATPVEYTHAFELEADQFHDLKLEFSNHASDALVELRWSTTADAPEIVPSFRLYSDPDVVEAAKRTYLRLKKAALLMNGFKLAPRELAYLADPGRADAFDLNGLPVDVEPANQQELFASWTRLSNFAALRMMPMRDPTSLLDVITSSTVTQAQAALIQVYGWDANALAELVGPEGFHLTDAEVKDTATLLKVAEGMRLLNMLGAPPHEVFDWATPTPAMQDTRKFAQEAKRALKAHYDNETWLEVARSLTDHLREAQRTALVAFLLPRLGFTDTGKLFGHFLIDVEMSPCMLTSRIKQAISSVQLFTQRCRMNLERSDDPKFDVDPKLIDANRWQWMQNYRVWEVNLKIFLYPENWIEPELRDDKSPFFRELESQLLQGEVTTENAELALGNYLEKVDTVSHLRICGLYEEYLAPDEKRESILHVFGHTFATPRVFYYRQRVTVNANYRYWTAWEKLPLDIEADEVLPVSWNRRLYVFWQLTHSSAEKDADGKATGGMTFERRLAWTEYRNGKWSEKRMTPVEQSVTVENRPTRLLARPGSERLSVEFWTDVEMTTGFVNVSFPVPSVVPFRRTFEGSLNFLNANGLVKAVKVDPIATQLKGFMPSVLSQAKVPTKLEFIHSPDLDVSLPVFAQLPNPLGELHFFSNGPRLYTLDDLFFLQEGSRAYLVQPHSFVPSDSLANATTADISPAYALEKSTRSASPTAVLPLQAQLTQLSTVTNPWLSSRAGLAVAELRAASPSANVGETKAKDTLSPTSQIFSYGVLNPGELYALAFPAELRFETFFHPYTAEFQKRMNRYGVPGLLNIDSQRPSGLPKLISFATAYSPESSVRKPWPEHNVDFEFTGAYSLYNWEIFFHVPLFLATRLSQNQNFEEAMRWFHFIFNPTAAASPSDLAPQCYWNVLPFRNSQPLGLDEMLKAISAGNANLIAQWEDLQAHPFQPHRVARMRLIAYQKTVVMKYIDNLVAWGDQLFRRDTIETINQATQLYVMAAELLGSLPQRLPQRGRNLPRTYDQLRTAGLDKLNQAMVSFENDLPFSSHATTNDVPSETAGLLGVGRTFYFGIPKNDKLLGYWDTVSDRLFKIRHCMNIEGVVRELPLFEPPIDPALLVRATAQGIDLSSVLNDLGAPIPFYRFGTLLSKAFDLTNELRSLGAALLAAMEKRDAEHLANLRTTHETELLSLVKQLKKQQVDEAKVAEESLQKTREVTQTRFDFYNSIPERLAEETSQLEQLKLAQVLQGDAQTAETTASAVATYVADISTGINIPPTGPPELTFSATLGRGNIIAYHQAVSRQKGFMASVHTYYANDSSILGSWKRRAEDWRLQKDLAFKELAQIDKQIAAAEIRSAIAQQDLDNTTRQIEQSQEIEEFLRTKFTGEELYSWMQGEISTIYFQCYQMTYDLAKKAERCFRFERGLANSNFIQFGAWDSLRKGLLSGERLYLQLKHMERAYMDGNRREYELTKHYSLLMNDPQALISLKGVGECEIELPETLFDSDYPGHYMRRIKSVSLTIPAVVGPYTSLNCTLTMLRDKTRVKASAGDGYPERDGQEDDRFMTNWAPLQAIATSTGQNDAGVFELNFRDERYLPFEGAGTISRWRIVLDQDANGFDLNSLSDVVLHIRYTAREGGERLRNDAQQALAQAVGEESTRPLARLFSLKHEFPSEWHRFTHTAAPAPAVGTFTIDKERFPFMFRGKSKTLTIRKVHLYAVLKEDAEPALPLSVVLTPPGGAENRVEFELKNKWREILATKNALDVKIEITATPESWLLKADPGDLAKNVDDLLLLCEYSVQLNR
jgi:Tc toxin complex TcA C-terminal TcB-binding domain/Neuraminidase-like domain/PA14 domain/Salmonella virulence plasmid 28.1kDa A protein